VKVPLRPLSYNTLSQFAWNTKMFWESTPRRKPTAPASRVSGTPSSAGFQRPRFDGPAEYERHDRRLP
jgi:hypothetical protein